MIDYLQPQYTVNRCDYEIDKSCRQPIKMHTLSYPLHSANLSLLETENPSWDCPAGRPRRSDEWKKKSPSVLRDCKMSLSLALFPIEMESTLRICHEEESHLICDCNTGKSMNFFLCHNTQLAALWATLPPISRATQLPHRNIQLGGPSSPFALFFPSSAPSPPWFALRKFIFHELLINHTHTAIFWTGKNIERMMT